MSKSESIILSSLLSTVSPDTQDFETGESVERNVDDHVYEATPVDQLFSSASADKVVVSGDDDDGFTFRIPRYFQALFTLFVCFFFLFGTLALISQVRKFCRKSSCTRRIPLVQVDSEKANGNGQPYNQSVSSDSTCEEVSQNKDSSDAQENGKDEKGLLAPKRVRFVRRVSGPFGDEALDFVGQTYKKKGKEKQQVEKLGNVTNMIRTQQSVRKANRSPQPPPRHVEP